MRILIFLIFTQIFVLAKTDITQSELILTKTFDEAISSAIHFLLERQKMDGSFVYDHEPFTGKTQYMGEPGYIVRIAGTLMSLCFAWDGKNEAVKKAIDKGLEYFRRHSTQFEKDGKKMRILSDTHEGYSGANCLYLTGWLWLHHKYPKDYPIKDNLVLELMNALDYYSDKSAGLTGYINTQETYIDKTWREPEIYASAQHFVVLALYHLVFKKTYWQPRLLSYLGMYNRKWVYADLIPSYHWVMLAYHFLLMTKNPDYTRVVIEQARQLQAGWENEVNVEMTKDNYCSQIEGESRWLLIKQEIRETNRAEIYELTTHLRHLLNFQIQANTKKKKTNKDKKITLMPLIKPEFSVGGFFNMEKNEHHTRIDFTQHCLMAYLNHRELMHSIPDTIEFYTLMDLQKKEAEEMEKARNFSWSEQKRNHKVVMKKVYETRALPQAVLNALQ